MVMSSESLEPSVTRAALDAVVQDGRTPGQEASPPEADDARLKAAVFSQPESEQQPPSLIGFAAAGMLLHDLVQESLSRRHDDEEEEDHAHQPKKHQPKAAE
jgi:hypothetical protein